MGNVDWSFTAGDESFPIPLKYVDVMRQRQKSTNNVSEHATNEITTEAKGVNLSEEWTGTTRFQILRTRFPEGYKWVAGGPYEDQEDHQTRQCVAWSLDTFTPKQKETQFAEREEEGAKLHAARRNRGIYVASTDDKVCFKVIADARLKLEKRLLLLCRALCQGRESSQTSDLHYPQWCQYRTVRVRKKEEHAEK